MKLHNLACLVLGWIMTAAGVLAIILNNHSDRPVEHASSEWWAMVSLLPIAALFLIAGSIWREQK